MMLVHLDRLVQYLWMTQASNLKEGAKSQVSAMKLQGTQQPPMGSVMFEQLWPAFWM